MTDSAPNHSGNTPSKGGPGILQRTAATFGHRFGRILPPLRSFGRALLPTYSSVEEVRKFFVNLLVLIGVLVGAAVIAKASSKSYVTIDPILVPKHLTERGFTGEVIAQRVHDEILRIGLTSKMNNPIGEFSTFSFERTLPKIDLPIGGMSLGSLVTSLRDFVGFVDTKIAGEITIEDDTPGQPASRKKYQLRLRITDKGSVYSHDEPTEDLDDLVRNAALKVVERFDPHIAAAYYYTQKRYESALRMIHRSLSDSTSKNDAAALNLRGQIAKEQQRYDAALATFQDVRNRFPDNPQALHNIAATLLLKGDYDQALEVAQEAIAKDPRQSAGYLAAGSAHYSLRRLDKALEYFEKGINAEPAAAIGYLTKASVYRAGSESDQVTALALFQRAADADPRDERVFLNWGAFLRQRGDMRQARVQFERAVDAQPNSPRPLHQLGLLLLDENKWWEAEKRLREARELDPESPYILHDLGRSWLYSGRIDEAADAFRQAIATDEGFALGHIMLASALAETTRLMKRYALLDRASEVEETNAQIEVITDDILDLIGRAGALAATEAKGEVLRETGKIYEVLERLDEAADAYRGAIAADEKRNAGLQTDINRLGRRIAAL